MEKKNIIKVNTLRYIAPSWTGSSVFAGNAQNH